jgi:hypothetical protein
MFWPGWRHLRKSGDLILSRIGIFPYFPAKARVVLPPLSRSCQSVGVLRIIDIFRAIVVKIQAIEDD